MSSNTEIYVAGLERGVFFENSQKYTGNLKLFEHDEDTIREADYIVDIGPYAGARGGEVIAAGTPEM